MTSSSLPFASTRITTRAALQIVGHKVKTSHADVGTAAPKVWGAATTDTRLQTLMKDAAPAAFVGVYCDYEDGYQGDYAMMVGVPSATDTKEGDLSTLTLPAGTYCEIVVEAPNPQKVVAAWNYVWQQMPERESRTYVADYEIHTADQATLYIGLDSPNA